MKRITLFLMFFALCLMSMAQGKLTPQAQMRVALKKARISKQLEKGQALLPSQQRMTLVVKVAAENATTTYSKMRAEGAVVMAKIGQQAVVSIPVDRIEAVGQIQGVERIDIGHKGKWKTDVTRNETGVSLIDGTTGTVETPYTGKGVTVCIFDTGIDFQHPAFKDADGNTRIKCVYMLGDETGNGHKFTIEDPEAGTIEFPGSVYDTPELIATLTTDDNNEFHGTHTTGIAAGSRSPIGFGGMAPDADIVLVTLSPDADEEQMSEYIVDEEDIVELVLSFATAYAQKSGQPLVFSGSINSHSGPHDGTGTVPEAIEAASASIIPVFSAGNEGGYPIHLYRKFTQSRPSLKTILALMEENGKYAIYDETVGYTRTGDQVSVMLSLCTLNQFTGKLTQVWTSDLFTATPGCDPSIYLAESADDATLAKYFTGTVGVAAFDEGNGRLSFSTLTEGVFKNLCLFQLTVSGSDGTEIDMWDNFGGFNIFEFSGYATGDNEMSAGDWTCVPDVISVGAYCANTTYRSYDGSAEDDEDEEDYVEGDRAWFSSFGSYENGVTQPVVSAPGVNIVSSMNHYYANMTQALDEMQWQGYPYTAESGTSMACPVVSGIVACWLQANPELTIESVKEVLRETSVNDDYTAVNPLQWGYGKVNAALGIEYILSQSAIRGVSENDTPTEGIIYDLQGRQVLAPTHGIYIKNGYKYVVK